MLKSNKFILSTFLLAILILTDCNDTSVNSIPSTSFFPIKVGNSWTYNYEYYDSLGNLLDQRIMKEEIVNTREKDGSNVYQLNSPFNPKSPACCDYRYYYKYAPDGIHWVIATDSTGLWVSDYLRFKYPCFVNDYFVHGRNAIDTTFVVSTNDTVVCEAGKFNCIVYKDFSKHYGDSTTTVIGYSKTYVAEGVGKIKVELYSMNSQQLSYKEIDFSLIGYDIE